MILILKLEPKNNPPKKALNLKSRLLRKMKENLVMNQKKTIRFLNLIKVHQRQGFKDKKAREVMLLLLKRIQARVRQRKERSKLMSHKIMNLKLLIKYLNPIEVKFSPNKCHSLENITIEMMKI